MLGAQAAMRVDVVHVQTRLGGPILASFLAQPFVAVVAVVDMRRNIAATVLWCDQRVAGTHTHTHTGASVRI